MSLIQAALNRTQKATSVPPAKTGEPAKILPQKIQKLKSFEKEVEAQVEVVQEKKPLPLSVPAASVERGPGLLYALLVLLFVTGFVYWIQPRPGNVNGQLSSAPLSAQPAAQVEKPVNWNQVFAPAPVKNDADEFKLSGVISGGDQPFAVVNNQIVKVGEMVNKKALLKDIGKDYVILEYNGNSFVLNLKH